MFLSLNDIASLSSHFQTLRPSAKFRMHSLKLARIYFIFLFLASPQFTCSEATFVQTDHLELTSGSYDDVHAKAVRIQVAEYEPAQKSLHTRRVRGLDGLYDFCLDDRDSGFRENWHTKPLIANCHPRNLYRIPVPSAFNDITSNATVKNYVGWVWYQKEFTIERDFHVAQREYFLHFESVNYMAIVYLQSLRSNESHLLGSHVGGYLPFMFNITDLLVSSTGINRSGYRLTVASSNKLTKDTIPSAGIRNMTDVVGYKLEVQQPDFDFFHFAGILGSVQLIQLMKLHVKSIDYLGFQKDLGHRFNICINQPVASYLHLRNHRWSGTESFLLEARIYNQEGVSLIGSSLSLRANQQCQLVELKPAIVSNSNKFWSQHNGNPNHFNRLQLARFELVHSVEAEACPQSISACEDKEQTLLDAVELRIGQKVDLGGNREGNNYKLRGFGMHQEQLFSGRSMNLAAIMKDIYLLKQVGANVIRTSHYPYSSDYLSACDENGISVIAECQAVGLKTFSELKLTLHKQLLLEMMQRDNHHPSIIMWSIANEPSSQLVEAREYFTSLVDYARYDLARYTTDADRPLTAAIAQSHSDDLVGHLLDVIMVNRYYGWYDYVGALETIRPALTSSLIGWANKHPGKPLILSEFGVDTLAGLHQTMGGIYSEEYQVKYLLEYERTLSEIASNNSAGVNLWGSMIWNFADFSTDISLLRIGSTNRKGIFTQNREPKQCVPSVRDIYLNNNHNHNGKGKQKARQK